MDGGLQHNRTPASSCSSERDVSLVAGAMVRLLFTLHYCFIISCLWDLGQIHSIIRITCFSEFQQTSNLQPAAPGMWGLGRKRSFNSVLGFGIYSLVFRGALLEDPDPQWSQSMIQMHIPFPSAWLCPPCWQRKLSRTYFLSPFLLHRSKEKEKLAKVQAF